MAEDYAPVQNLSPARYYSSTAVQTQLASGISAGATNFTVNDATGYPVSYPYTVILDLGTDAEEIVDVTNAVGATFTATRGVDGTTPVSHSVGASVVHGVSARDPREAQAHIAATGGVHGIDPASTVVGTTDTQTLTHKTLTSPTLTTPIVNNAAATAGTYTNPTLVTPTIASYVNADHTHADAASGGNLPESSVTGLVADLAALTASIGTAPAKANLPINVKDRGAVGDGVADDAGAIQSALDAAHTAGGGWVWVPAGTYKLVTLPLRIYSNTRLTLDPKATFKRAAALTVIVNGDASQTLGGYTGHGHLIIEGGTWDMQGPVITGYNVCISLGHAEGITIRDLEIRDVPGFHAIEINAVRDARIQNCRMLGVYQTGDRAFTEAIQIDLAKGSAYFGAFGPYDNTPCDDVLISGCYFGASDTANTAVWPRGVGTHSSTITRWQNNIRITGNHFAAMSQYGVGGYSWRNTVISGNTFVGCGGGILVQATDPSDTEDTKDTGGTQTSASQVSDNHVISGNVIQNTGTYGDAIELRGYTTGMVRHAVIAGNTIDTTGAGSAGVHVASADESIISNNYMRSTGGTGVVVAIANLMSVANNTIISPGVNGITVDFSSGGANNSVRGNQIRLAANNGISLIGGSLTQIQNNFISGASRSANITFYGILVSQSANGVLLSGNRCRKIGSGNEPINGMHATNTCTEITRYGNDWHSSGATANLDDNSPTPITQATDVTT